MATPEKNPREVMLKDVRISFCDALKEPTASIANGPKKYRANFIIEPKSEFYKENLAKMRAAVEAAEMEEFGKTGVIEKIHDPKRKVFREGSEFQNADGDVYTGYDVEGAYGLATLNAKRPLLLYRNKERVEVEDIQDTFIPGHRVDAKVYVYCTSKTEQGGRGLFAMVNSVRYRKKDEAFGGSHASADDYDDLEDDDDDADF
jgi:hypothetical protein